MLAAHRWRKAMGKCNLILFLVVRLKQGTGREAFIVALKAASVSGNHQSGVVFDPV